MMTPTIHLNGTSRRELLEQIEDAYAAIDNALDKLAAMSPNGRDYYPQGPHALATATNEHLARIAPLAQIKRDLEAMCDAIYATSA